MNLRTLAQVLQYGSWVDWTHHTLYCVACTSLSNKSRGMRSTP